MIRGILVNMDKIKTKIGWKNNLDKLLFILASLYLILILGLWLKNRQQTVNSQSQTVNPNKQIISESNLIETNTINNQNTEENLLNDENISPNQEDIENQILSTGNNITSTLEIPPLPSNQSTVNNIPLPPPDLQPLPIPQPPQPVANSSITTNNLSNNNPKPNLTSSSSIPKVNKVPVIASLSKDNSNIPEQIALNSVPESTEEKTQGNYTLIGLVQLPDSKSVALFKVNNITEKVSLGKEIGATGWVLMAVNEKQAVVSKQNQSVYLQVGETF
ncbi:hypothetical protein CSQ80_15775 [Cyanobacterium aponinum IPPAS B-1201]|nr:hypothetical protein CSQ80_15775 [Cyanobacterium aponinum IPPAS B-1201]